MSLSLLHAPHEEVHQLADGLALGPGYFIGEELDADQRRRGLHD